MEKFSGKNLKKTAGFTLIEILVVIGIIAVLAAIVIVAINPARQFAQARNTQRESNINTVLNAIGQNLADNKGIFGGVCATTLPINTASSSIIIGAGGTLPAGDPAATKDLSCLAPTYISTFPTDPAAASGGYTGYTISVDASGRILVCAPASDEASLGTPAEICVKR